jgi:phage terminase small subunit
MKKSARRTTPGVVHTPSHLLAETQQWVASVESKFELEDHHRRLLLLAAEAWDSGLQAREAIAKHGQTFKDRFGAPHARPEVAIERDSKIVFSRLLRELALDVAPPDSRPPGLGR